MNRIRWGDAVVFQGLCGATDADIPEQLIDDVSDEDLARYLSSQTSFSSHSGKRDSSRRGIPLLSPLHGWRLLLKQSRPTC